MPDVHDIIVRPNASHLVGFTPAVASDFDDLSMHSVFQVTFQDGSAFAIDVCSAQFRLQDASTHPGTVLPWEEYLRRLWLAAGAAAHGQDLHSLEHDAAGTKPCVLSAMGGVRSPQVMHPLRACNAIANVIVARGKFEEERRMSLAQLIRHPDNSYRCGIAAYKSTYTNSVDDLFAVVL